MAEEYLVKEKKGNMCKILYLLTQIAKRSIWMRDYEYPNVLSLGVGGGTLGTVDRGRAGYI